jgi:hypothetical protein
MNDGATVRWNRSAGWGLAEGMLSGLVTVRGNAGNGAAASIRGGTVVVHGDCAARAGVAMKGGLLLIGGDAGYMTGFMMQKGTVVICGDAGDALADSMYEGVIFVGGAIASLGNDAVIERPRRTSAAGRGPAPLASRPAAPARSSGAAELHHHGSRLAGRPVRTNAPPGPPAEPGLHADVIEEIQTRPPGSLPDQGWHPPGRPWSLDDLTFCPHP